MAPVKFDDISKTANDVVSEDYKLSGFEFKAKQKANWQGSVLTTTVDVWGKDACQTPAKLTWKFPTPFGISLFSVDKFEVDKSGKFKLEASADKAIPLAGLKLEVKSDCVDMGKASAGFTYTGIADTQLKFETKAATPEAFTAEVTRTQGPITFGARLNGASVETPDLGMRFTQGPFFGSLVLKDKYSAYSAHGYYKASDALKLAGVYDCKKSVGTFSVGLAYELSKETNLKVKVQRDKTISFSAKHELAKGLTLLGGVKYDTAKGHTYGLSLSVE